MWAKILLLFFVFSFLFRTDHAFDQDLGRHIKLGEIIWQTHQVPKTNLFSYTNSDFPFINTHWLFEVLAYFFAAFNILPLFLILKVIIFLLSVWLLFKVIPKENSILLLPLGFIFLHVLRERLELRPEIFSFLFTSLTLFILERFSKTQTRLIFLLPLVQLFWINTHIYFFVGLLLQAIYLIHIGLHHLRSHTRGGKLNILLIVFGLSVIASLINPNGLSGVLYPLNVTKNYGYTIVENQTMFLLESINFRDPNFLFVKIAIAITLLSIIIVVASSLRRQGSINIKNILLAISGVALALLNVRSFPYLVFLSLPAVLANFGNLRKNALFSILYLVTCILLLTESYFYLNGDYYKFTDNSHQVGLKFIESSKGSLDFTLKNDLPGPIYNNFDIGSYIIYKGYPKLKVFVDGRPEAYPKDFFQQEYIPGQADYSKFKEQEGNWQFKTIIFSHTDQTPWGRAFLQSLFKDQSWKLIYIDNFMVVLVKEEVAKEKNLAVIDLSRLSPNQYSFSNSRDSLLIGIFLFSQNFASGKQFIDKALEINPNSPAANTIMGQITTDSAYQARSQNNFFW